MPSILFDEPSLGEVSDEKPAMTTYNRKGAALYLARLPDFPDVQPYLGSSSALICHAETSTAIFEATSDYAIGSFCTQGASVVASGWTSELGAVTAINEGEGFGGFGSLSISKRDGSVGAAGVASGIRSKGIYGVAELDTGVHGIGGRCGVYGESAAGVGIVGVTLAGDQPAILAEHRGEDRNAGAGLVARAIVGPAAVAESKFGVGLDARSEIASAVYAVSDGSGIAAVRAINERGIGIQAESDTGNAVVASTSSGTAIQAYVGSGQAIICDGNGGGEPFVDIWCGLGPALRIRAVTGTDKPLSEFAVATGTAIRATSLDGLTVEAKSVNGSGVYGTSLTRIGVFGASSRAWAGYFAGNVRVSGTIYKSDSNFLIDHPLDPKGKVLKHAAVEAPERKTMQDGVATLDRKGLAVVRMPSWFAALNTDLRYQLTPIGAPAPELHVAKEFDGRSFWIAGGLPGQKVCWQVTGVRQDTWAKENPFVVEQKRKDLPEEPAEIDWKLYEKSFPKPTKKSQAKRPKVAASNVHSPSPHPSNLKAELEQVRQTIERASELRQKRFSTSSK